MNDEFDFGDEQQEEPTFEEPSKEEVKKLMDDNNGLVPKPPVLNTAAVGATIVREPQLMDEKTMTAMLKAEVSRQKQVRDVSLTFLKKNDYIKIKANGKPVKDYLLCQGLYKLAALFGLTWVRHKDDPHKEVFPDGKNIAYITRVRIYNKLHDRFIDEIGVATTKDNLFGKGNPAAADIGNIIKKSITNAESRAIGRMLGVTDILPQELQDVDSEDPDTQTASIDYKTKTKSSEDENRDDIPHPPAQKELDEKGKEAILKFAPPALVPYTTNQIVGVVYGGIQKKKMKDGTMRTTFEFLDWHAAVNKFYNLLNHFCTFLPIELKDGNIIEAKIETKKTPKAAIYYEANEITKLYDSVDDIKDVENAKS